MVIVALLLFWTIKKKIQIVIAIMKKPIKQKKEKEFIKQAFMDLPAFKDKQQMLFKNAATFDSLLEDMQLEFFQKQQTIFHMGDYGDKFYIVITGQVYLLLPSIVW